MISEAAQEVCDELTPILRGYVREFGVSRELAESLTVVWDGETFTAQSSEALDTVEYGDGLGPAPRPILKALNRLHADAEQLLTERVMGAVAETAEGAC